MWIKRKKKKLPKLHIQDLWILRGEKFTFNWMFPLNILSFSLLRWPLWWISWLIAGAMWVIMNYAVMWLMPYLGLSTSVWANLNNRDFLNSKYPSPYRKLYPIDCILALNFSIRIWKCRIEFTKISLMFFSSLNFFFSETLFLSLDTIVAYSIQTQTYWWISFWIFFYNETLFCWSNVVYCV